MNRFWESHISSLFSRVCHFDVTKSSKKQDIMDLNTQAFWIKVLDMAEKERVGNNNWEGRVKVNSLGLVVQKQYPEIRRECINWN